MTVSFLHRHYLQAINNENQKIFRLLARLLKQKQKNQLILLFFFSFCYSFRGGHQRLRVQVGKMRFEIFTFEVFVYL